MSHMLMYIAKPAAMKCIRYKELVNDEDHERLTRVLTALEKKDDMQQRMEAITKSVPSRHTSAAKRCLHQQALIAMLQPILVHSHINLLIA